MKNQNILSAYCFLAALTENNNDLYNHVYVPICKRALSEYSKRGKEFGTNIDIKEIILEIYGIDVPESIVCKLIRVVEVSMSRRQKDSLKFKVLDNGREFQLEKWAFTDLDEKYKKSERDANAIQEAFEEYLRIKNTFNEKVPSFTEFLNKYKLRLSSFFTGELKTIEGNEEETFFYHVEFLEHIQRSNHTFYKIAEDLYLGVIVASFIESGFEVEQNQTIGEVFYLDTPIILRALDLQKPEETRPVLELINLIKNTHCVPKVLSITIEEIQRVIGKAIEFYNNSHPVTSINEACKRKTKDKAWLLTFNMNLVRLILEDLKIEIEPVSNDFIKANENSPDIDALKETRFFKNSASHDVYSYLFVRSQRGQVITVHQNAKIWFVTSNPSLLEFNIEKKLSNSVPEIVLPDMLTSLLWLKNPIKLVNNVKSIGLRELMSSTLLEEVPSKELINEYSNQLKKIEDLNVDSYTILLEAVAHYSANRIEKFIETFEKDPVNAKAEALQIVDEEIKRRAEIQQKIADTIDEKEYQKLLNQELEEKIAKIELDHKEKTDKAEKDIKDLQDKLLDQDKTIEKQSKKLEDHDKKIEEQATQLQNIIIQIKRDYKKLIIGFFCVALFILTFIFKNSLGDLTWITRILSGSGWLWGFGSFGVNIYHLLMENKI
jgi:hypothetical protein